MNNTTLIFGEYATNDVAINMYLPPEDDLVWSCNVTVVIDFVCMLARSVTILRRAVISDDGFVGQCHMYITRNQ